MNESTLRREERGGIDYWSRSDFALLFRFGRLGSGRGSRRSTSFTTASSLAAATRISGFATASGLSAATAAAVLFAATAAEDAIQQGHAATFLDYAFGSAAIAAAFATTGGLSATTGIASLLATTSGLGATAGICTTAVTRLLFAVMTTQQVQQRGPAALLGSATTAVVATFVATFIAAASRLSATSGLCATTGIRTTGVAATVTAALLAFLASTQQVQQRCLAALGLAGHALYIASSITAAAGAWIRTGCVTTADFIGAAVVIRSKHSVE